MKLFKYITIFMFCYTSGRILGEYLRKLDAWKKEIDKAAPLCKYCKNCEDLYYSEKKDLYGIKCKAHSLPEDNEGHKCQYFQLSIARGLSCPCLPRRK